MQSAEMCAQCVAMCLKATILKKVRVGVDICAHLSFELAFFDWRFEDIFVERNVLLSLIGLTASGRPVLVFCSKCCIAQGVCCEFR